MISTYPNQTWQKIMCHQGKPHENLRFEHLHDTLTAASRLFCLPIDNSFDSNCASCVESDAI